jgi:hypothetical protein
VSAPTVAEQKRISSPASTPARSLLPPQRPAFAPPAEDFQPASLQTEPAAGHNLNRMAIHSALERTAAQDCPLPAGPRACPFGGACHTCPTHLQAKLAVGEPDDEYEREADRAAERVMRMPEPANAQRRACPEREAEDSACGGSPDGRTPPLIQRQIDPEEEEDELDEDETLRTKSSGSRTPKVGGALQDRIQAMRGGGRPLDAEARAFLEPRFGADFSRIRIHDQPDAADSARSLSARAFTLGRDIFFGGGEYSPGTRLGKELLAHELAHVVQQAGGKPKRIQRMSIGQGRPPANWGFRIRPVPANERKRVLAAIGIVEAIATSPRRHKRCHGLYAKHCPNGQPNTLREIVRRARIWKITDSTAVARGDVNGPIIAYTDEGYSDGARGLAQTLLHELMHNCGITGRKHHLAEGVSIYCMGQRNIFSVAVGANVSTGDAQVLVSYRRILRAFAAGRLKLTAGADINLMGAAVGINQAAGTRPPWAGGIGSGMFGVRGHLGRLWGAEGHGGFSGLAETGFGAGYFRMRWPRPGEDPDRTHVAGSYVLQLGLGAEFYIPLGLSSGVAMPVSFEVAYRLVQPLNSKARQIHALLGTFSFHFK